MHLRIAIYAKELATSPLFALPRLGLLSVKAAHEISKSHPICSMWQDNSKPGGKDTCARLCGRPTLCGRLTAVTSSYRSLLRTQEKIWSRSLSITSVGFVPMTSITVEASHISHSCVVSSSFLGQIQLRGNSKHARRARILLSANLFCI